MQHIEFTPETEKYTLLPHWVLLEVLTHIVRTSTKAELTIIMTRLRGVNKQLYLLIPNNFMRMDVPFVIPTFTSQRELRRIIKNEHDSISCSHINCMHELGNIMVHQRQKNQELFWIKRTVTCNCCNPAETIIYTGNPIEAIRLHTRNRAVKILEAIYHGIQ